MSELSDKLRAASEVAYDVDFCLLISREDLKEAAAIVDAVSSPDEPQKDESGFWWVFLGDAKEPVVVGISTGGTVFTCGDDTDYPRELVRFIERVKEPQAEKAK